MAQRNIYNSAGDTTTSSGSGSFVGTGVPDILDLQGPVQAGVVAGVQTAIRVQTANRAIWGIWVVTPTWDGGVFIYSRDELICSSTGEDIEFPVGSKRISFEATAESFIPVLLPPRPSSGGPYVLAYSPDYGEYWQSLGG